MYNLLHCFLERFYSLVVKNINSLFTKLYNKVHMATRWTIRHSLMLLGFKDLMNVTEKVTIHRPNVSTLLSSAFIRGDLNAATRGPFIRSLTSCLFFLTRSKWASGSKPPLSRFKGAWVELICEASKQRRWW